MFTVGHDVSKRRHIHIDTDAAATDVARLTDAPVKTMDSAKKRLEAGHGMESEAGRGLPATL